ncbi:heavy-metal-associated domain-containing protein [Hymenobacter sp. 15J16-1T3B]|uniref:heavy-metal-associated domain-containing protein n=1 Tax=Hymenobacter sp. 15J16-1T3B TaxID=2886941 RepID=UPI001D112E99|nr:heavy metal-associated domain-containing protein [Hymenobacter sp. 15J16-1T3B]MCC3158184.1 heavy-metal-associated domain-containing protein [Hymenobacter sp. 15J16-1T3B]
MNLFRSLLLTFSVVFTAAAAQAQTTPAAKAKAKPGTEQVQIKTSAVCDMCKARLEKAMAYEKGVQSALLDVPTQVLTVSYRADKTTPEALRAAVTATGYDADATAANAKAYDRLPDCCKKTNAVH